MDECNMGVASAAPNLKATHDPLLCTEDLARNYGTTKAFWEQLRTHGGGPEFIKLGRLIRYRQSAVDSWLTSRTVTSTTAARRLRRNGADQT